MRTTKLMVTHHSNSLMHVLDDPIDDSNMNNTEGLLFLKKVELGLATEPYPDIELIYSHDNPEEDYTSNQSVNYVFCRMISINRPIMPFINYKLNVINCIKGKRCIYNLISQNNLLSDTLYYSCRFPECYFFGFEGGVSIFQTTIHCLQLFHSYWCKVHIYNYKILLMMKFYNLLPTL